MGGITKVSSFVALFGGNKLHVAVLTDHGQGDRKKVRELQDSALLRQRHVFTADMFAPPGTTEADTEDILGRDLYVRVVNAAYGLTAGPQVPAKRPGNAPARVTEEVKNHFRTLPPGVAEYDHFPPSAHLLTHASSFDGKLVEEALDRFEKLFIEVNSLL